MYSLLADLVEDIEKSKNLKFKKVIEVETNHKTKKITKKDVTNILSHMSTSA